jgi:hypothetical protein
MATHGTGVLSSMRVIPVFLCKRGDAELPSSVPRVVVGGVPIRLSLALSAYAADEDYAATSPRARRLWSELAEPLSDARDAYFVRVVGLRTW